MRYVWLLMGVLALVACGANPEVVSERVVENVVVEDAPAGTPSLTTTNPEPTAEPIPATNTPQPTDAPAEESAGDEPAVEPTVEPTALPEAPPAPVVIAGRTADGGYFLGAETAQLTLIDYSDFL